MQMNPSLERTQVTQFLGGCEGQTAQGGVGAGEAGGRRRLMDCRGRPKQAPTSH